MEKMKINKDSKVTQFKNLDFEYIQEKNGELVIKLNGKQCYSINHGDYLYFERNVFCEDNGINSFNGVSVVNYEDSNHIIHSTLLENNKIYLEKDFYELKHTNNGSYYIISCKTNHYLFAQDLDTINQEVYFKRYDGKILGTYKGIHALNIFREGDGRPSPLENEVTAEFNKNDCIVHSDLENTCGKQYDYIETRHYNFFPKSESTKKFILTDFNEIESKEAFYIEFKFNPFYYYIENRAAVSQNGEPEIDSYNNPIKNCYLYGDKWFDSFHDTTTVKYVNDNPNVNRFGIYKSYYSTDITFYSDSNESNLGTEDYFSKKFANKIEESLIPDFIDMERVKYAPYEKDGLKYLPITSITIYNHFRKRVRVDAENNNNTLSTSGNLFCDGWYIDNDNNYNVYWNGYEGNGSIDSILEFVTQNGTTSDLIGFLNFTDNDIYYRKQKVSKSFFRLSFYDSKDPIEQKLLYYSTVYLDSANLFSKFLKQKSFIDDSKGNGIIINDFAANNENVKVVFCENEDVECRLDTTVIITNEYDKSKCSEGFNIYLFSDDVPNENDEKTIYMRVEFNHAGNGKTIPMIIMPNEKLTIDNFIDNLYIPIKIRRYNEKYIYTIDNAVYDGSGDVKLILFEAKLEYNN